MAVYNYRLISPQLFYENALLLRRVIFPVPDSFFSEETRFDISPYTGFITFFDYKLMWKTNGDLGPLSDADSAKIFAENYLRDFNRRMTLE